MELKYLIFCSLALVIVLLLLARILYWRVPHGVGYIRSGWGRQKVILEGASLVIPGVHRIDGIKLKNFTVNAVAAHEKSLITEDFFRVNMELRLLVRVKSEAKMVLAARSVFDGGVEQVSDLLEQRCLSVMQTIAGGMSLEKLLLSTVDFETEVRELLDKELARLGLEVVLVSVTEVQQSSQLDYQRSNHMDAKALSVLESMRTESSRVLHTKVKDAELQMKKLDFEVSMKKLGWDEQYFTAQLEHRRQTATIKAHLAQEIKEIEVSQQLAIEMIEQDFTRMQLQNRASTGV